MYRPVNGGIQRFLSRAMSLYVPSSKGTRVCSRGAALCQTILGQRWFSSFAPFYNRAERRTLPENGGHWPFLRPGSPDLAALSRVSKPRITGFRARIGGFSTRDQPLPPAQPAAVPSPANLPSAIEAAPSASGSVRQALSDLYKSSEKLSRSYST